ncbi:cytochrome P450 [Cohnella sp. CFH 77786]|nr:cytochrome P450 [Cohnella sp. CFH 77786]MBW5447065.1 cytochrome P450 [Cohnella sp. CFH 77786]
MATNDRTWLGGHLKAFRRNPLAFFEEMHKQYGMSAQIRFGPKKINLLYDPEMVKEVLITKSESFIRGGFSAQEVKRFLGEGVIFSEGDEHKKHRRMLQPRFTRAHIQQYAEQMSAIAAAHAELWKDSEELQLSKALFGITFDILARTIFSFDSSDQLTDIGRAYSVINRIGSEKLRHLFKLPLFVPTKQNKEYLEAIGKLDEIVYSLIAKRRKEKDATHQDLLSVLMAAVDETDQSTYTDTQLRDELMGLFFAGHETTANTLLWTFYFLMQNPEAEAKLHAEWNRVLGGRDANADDFPQLTYTQHVLSEALRLMPVAFMVYRTAARDVIIGNIQIAKGEIVFISPYVIHRSSAYFSDPLAFRPERFENDMVKKIPQFAYFPFGGGARACIGNHYAMLEMMMVLCAIGRRFRMRLAPNHHEVVPEALLTLVPKDGIRVVLEKR